MSDVCPATLIPKILAGFVLGCCLVFIPPVVQSASANSATLQWAANSESDIAGYKVYQGITAGSYGPAIDAGNGTTYMASNLQSGLTYYFAVTAYDINGNESPPSDEVSKYLTSSSSTLSVSVVGNGSVSSSPSGIQCTSGTCSASYEVSSSIALVAQAGKRRTFVGWSGACSGTGECVIQLATDQFVGATFSKTGSTGSNGAGKGKGNKK